MKKVRLSIIPVMITILSVGVCHAQMRVRTYDSNKDQVSDAGRRPLRSITENPGLSARFNKGANPLQSSSTRQQPSPIVLDSATVRQLRKSLKIKKDGR